MTFERLLLDEIKIIQRKLSEQKHIEKLSAIKKIVKKDTDFNKELTDLQVETFRSAIRSEFENQFDTNQGDYSTAEGAIENFKAYLGEL